MCLKAYHFVIVQKYKKILLYEVPKFTHSYPEEWMAGGGVALDGDGHSEVDAAGEGNVGEGEEGGDEADELLGLQEIGRELGQAEQQHRQHWGHKLYCTNGHHHKMKFSTLGSGDIVFLIHSIR